MKYLSFVLVAGAILYSYVEYTILHSVDRRAPLPESQLRIDNKLYDGVDWWADEGPFRLLRLMNHVRVPFFADKLVGKSEILDIGCGGGFVSEALSLSGFRVTGIDASSASLIRARAHADSVGATNVRYLEMSAYALKFPDASFDGVVISDVLEHLNDLNLVASEISRVLKPGGVLVFDTINRSLFSFFGIFLVAQELLPILPRAAHDWKLFIRPQELVDVFARHKMTGAISEWKGIIAKFGLGGIAGFETSDTDLSGSYAGYLVKQ